MKKLIILLLALALMGCQKGGVMAVEFSGGSSQRIEFTPGAAVTDQEGLTVCFWTNLDGVSGSYERDFFKQYAADETESWMIYTLDNGSDKLGVIMKDVEGGSKGASTEEVEIGGWAFYCITLPFDNVTNPQIYKNVVEVAYTSQDATFQTHKTEAGGVLRIGGGYSTYTIDGTLEDPRIYNSILSQVDMTELYQSRMVRSVSNGLVFHPVFCGAAGLTRFDGATLGTANTIVDNISGAVGIPYGNPIGRGNTIQRIY